MLKHVQHGRRIPRRAALASFLLLSCLFFVSCEREILTNDPRISIDGYEIRGLVLDRLGNPMPGVRVRVDYDLFLEDTNDPPSKSHQVSAPSEVIQVRVHNYQGVLYRSFPPVTAQPGIFEFTWDQLSGTGLPAPSGIYYVSYLRSGTEVLKYPVLVRDNVVTATDSLGRYAVLNTNLPIDFYPVPQYSGSGGQFYGNYRVSDQVYLTFEPNPPIPSIFRMVRVVRDRVVEFDVRYN